MHLSLLFERKNEENRKTNARITNRLSNPSGGLPSATRQLRRDEEKAYTASCHLHRDGDEEAEEGVENARNLED